MNKKLTLLLAILSLANYTSLYTAHASFPASGEIFHQVKEGKLELSTNPTFTSNTIIDLTQRPFGDDEDELTLNMLIKAAHKSGRPFSFILGRTQNNNPTILLTDDNLFPLTTLPATITPVCKYKLFGGGKGYIFHPDFVVPHPQPSVMVQPMPYPVHVPAPFPVHHYVEKPVGVPVPVYVDRVVTKVETIPYFSRSATSTPAFGSSPEPHENAQPASPVISAPTSSSPQAGEQTQGLLNLLATLQMQPKAHSTNTPESHISSPANTTATTSFIPFFSPTPTPVLRVDRILHPNDPDSNFLMPRTSPSPATSEPSIHSAPSAKRNKKRGKRSNVTPLAAVAEEEQKDLQSEADKRTLEEAQQATVLLAQEQTRLKQEEDRIREEERQALKQQQREQEEQARRDAEAAAAQEVRAREEEKKRAKAEKEKARLQREQDEQARREAKRQEEEARAEQARKDREAAKAQKEKKEREEREAKAAANRESKKKKSSSTTPSPRPSTKNIKDDEDAFLEKEMAAAAAARAALASQPAAAAAPTSRRRSSSAQSLPASAASADSCAWPTLSVGDGSPSNPFDFALDASPERDMMEKIEDCIENGLYLAAKKLLEQITPGTLKHTIFLTDIYVNAEHHLTSAEVETLMRTALTFAKDKKVDRWERAVLYFALALHATDADQKEDLLDQCIKLDTGKQHLRAHALKLILQLKRFDAHTHGCDARAGECFHKYALSKVKDLEAQNNYFGETIFLKLYLLAKASRGSCWQIRSVLQMTPDEIKQALIDFYDTKVRQSDHNRTELAEINSIIPSDIIPPDQFHQFQERE